MRETVLIFEKLTKYDLTGYLQDYVDFIDNNYQLIVDYYKGLISEIDPKSFIELRRLLNESNNVESILNANLNQFLTADFWDLTITLDDIKIKLETALNFSKYARSSLLDNQNFKTDPQFQFILKENQTLENLARQIGEVEFNDNWAEIAIDNDLIEEDYTPSGGILLQLNLKNNLNVKVGTVVDIANGKTIYGKDIFRKITFENNDLKVLDNDETILQSVNILINLSKNDNPEFPEYGMDKTIVTGITVKSSTLPILIKQIFNTFATNEAIKEVTILNVKYEDTVTNMDLSIKTQLDKDLQTNLILE